MTIDEAINHAKEVAERNRKQYKTVLLKDKILNTRLAKCVHNNTNSLRNG